MQREAETGQGAILGADEGQSMNQIQNALYGISGRSTIGACYCSGACHKTGVCPVNAASNAALGLPFKAGHFDNPPLNDVLCAADVLLARLDRDAKGQVHHEIKYAVLVQVMRSIATEQVGASASVKALALAALEVCE